MNSLIIFIVIILNQIIKRRYPHCREVGFKSRPVTHFITAHDSVEYKTTTSLVAVVVGKLSLSISMITRSMRNSGENGVPRMCTYVIGQLSGST